MRLSRAGAVSTDTTAGTIVIAGPIWAARVSSRVSLSLSLALASLSSPSCYATAPPSTMLRRQSESSLTIKTLCSAPMVSSALCNVSLHVRRSILYLFWACIYVSLVLLEPLIQAVVVSTDWIWLRWPWSDMRNLLIAISKRIITACSPALAERYLSRSFLGSYVGMDRSFGTARKKQLPLHSVSLNGCAWMLPYHIGVCEGKNYYVYFPSYLNHNRELTITITSFEKREHG